MLWQGWLIPDLQTSLTWPGGAVPHTQYNRPCWPSSACCSARCCWGCSSSNNNNTGPTLTRTTIQRFHDARSLVSFRTCQSSACAMTPLTLRIPSAREACCLSLTWAPAATRARWNAAGAPGWAPRNPAGRRGSAAAGCPLRSPGRHPSGGCVGGVRAAASLPPGWTWRSSLCWSSPRCDETQHSDPPRATRIISGSACFPSAAPCDGFSRRHTPGRRRARGMEARVCSGWWLCLRWRVRRQGCTGSSRQRPQTGSHLPGNSATAQQLGDSYSLDLTITLQCESQLWRHLGRYRRKTFFFFF